MQLVPENLFKPFYANYGLVLFQIEQLKNMVQGRLVSLQEMSTLTDHSFVRKVSDARVCIEMLSCIQSLSLFSFITFPTKN